MSKPWPFKKRNLEILRIAVLTEVGETQVVDSPLVRGPLAVTPRIGEGPRGFPWSITHVPTGCGLRLHCRTLQVAEVVLEELLSWDWVEWETITPHERTRVAVLEEQVRKFAAGFRIGDVTLFPIPRT